MSARNESAANDDLTLGQIAEDEAWAEHTAERIEQMAAERSAAYACECAGPMVNAHVDGNGGHSPGCPANPNTWPEQLRVCGGCGIPFWTPITPEQALRDFGSLDVAEYVCKGCEPDA